MSTKRSPRKRQYNMGARAEAAAATRLRILQAAAQLFGSASYDEVSLEQVAERAEVALKTVVRKFGTKGALLLACARGEKARRNVSAGDVAGVVRTLVARYEETMDPMIRYIGVETRVPEVGAVLSDARQGHWQWLAEVFAPCLPQPQDPRHRRRVAQLFAATEIFVWHSWRRQFGMGRDSAAEAMREMLEALIASWKEEP